MHSRPEIDQKSMSVLMLAVEYVSEHGIHRDEFYCENFIASQEVAGLPFSIQQKLLHKQVGYT